MGLAQLDLPDPRDVMEYPGAGASAPAADELLSQMAGEEIDRLLSESDVERDVPASPAPRRKEAQPQRAAAKAIAPAEPTKGESPSNQADDAAAPVTPDRPATTRSRATDIANTQVAQVAPAANGASIFAAVAQSLSDTIAASAPSGPAPSGTALSGPLPSETAPPPAATASTASPALVSPESITQAAISAVEADRFAGTQEMGLLSDLPTARGSAVATDSAAAAAPPSADIDPELLAELDAAVERGALTAPMPAINGGATESRATPWYVRVLEWINSPLDAYPESVREMVGKIAIITGVNAVAVLIYVLVFRRG
ncbi:MAG TPA: hypothetical protein VFC78_15910 [Tepidisphaeraceae bacterium]|nr:hypothetical protein [Tepidisphaeraceae bacterium]